MACQSPTGTRAPQRPPARISRGPTGQSVATTGVLLASASTSTLPKPSNREASANTAARAIQWRGPAMRPGRAATLAKPSWWISACSASRCGPSPAINRRVWGCRRCRSAKACSSVGRSFSTLRRDTLSTTCNCGSCSQRCSGVLPGAALALLNKPAASSTGLAMVCSRRPGPTRRARSARTPSDTATTASALRYAQRTRGGSTR